MVSRRYALGLIGAGATLAGLPRIAFAAAETDKRFVVVMLRGAMDGLSAVPAYGDPSFDAARNGLALATPGQSGGSLKLDAMFALHPNLGGMKALYDADELIVVHACATPYRDRSHFDGQNLLEAGSEQPYGLDTGWLNRALTQIPGTGKPLGVALNSHMPLMLRGPAPVTSWAPSLLPAPDADTIQRLAMLYGETDPKLAQSFTDAQGANGVAMGSGRGGGGYQAFAGLMTAAAKFLSTPDGERIAMVEIGGWDTHVNQAGAFSPLSTNLLTLDKGLQALKTGLGPLWKDTAVVIATVTIISGPLKPGPKPAASMSNDCRVLVPAGSLPASLLSSRIANTGMSRTTMIASDAIASGHGRACTTSLQRRHAERRGSVLAPAVRRRPNRCAPAALGRTSRVPRRPDRRAGSSVSDATMVSSTAITAAIAKPYMKATPVANIPSNAITTVAPASRIARPDVSIAAITDPCRSPDSR